jgi:hypothetical protein
LSDVLLPPAVADPKHPGHVSHGDVVHHGSIATGAYRALIRRGLTE